MNLKANTACPPTNTLNDFVQGKLEPPTLGECESHISECPNCLETLRGLGSNDTLTKHLAAAMNEPDTSRSSEQCKGLMERMLSQTPKAMLPSGLQPSVSVTAELMADRAAEVLRCLQPTDDESLGSIGDYTLERLIGAGSSGVVFKAIDRTLNRPVALKVLRPSLGAMARQRFIAEAQSAAAIEHPNVVTIYQVGESKRLAFMAMQWIPGQTLEQQLAAGKQFEEADVRTIARQISSGLQAAHAQQIIHRDIKPANIWITEADQSVKILDFGLARISDDDPGLTATGMLAGTPNFMSPEQTKGLELDGRSDLFSLGCLMYRLLSGRLPFGAPTVLATLQSIQNHQPVAVQSLQPTVGDELNDLTMALLEKQSANRPGSAEQLAELLRTDRSAWPIQINRYTTEANANSSPRELQTPVVAASGGGFFRWIAALVGLGLFGFSGYLFAPQIIRIATDQGEVVIETDDPDVQVEILQDGKLVQVLDTKTDQAFSIRSGNYEFRASQTTDAENAVTFDVTPKQLVMKRGQQQIVKVEKRSAAQDFQPVQSQLSRGSNSSEQLLYDNKNFAYWLQVARTDRSPKALANAIRACGALAVSSDQQSDLFDVMDSAARRHGNMIWTDNNSEDDRVMYAMLTAIWKLPPERAADFVAKQLQDGNSRSQQFCVWILVGGHASSINPSRLEFNLAYASRLSELLPIAIELEGELHLGQYFIESSLSVPREELVELNPTILVDAKRMYWEHANGKDTQVVDSLTKLAAHLQLDDAKLVSNLIDRYSKTKRKWDHYPPACPNFRALTYNTIGNTPGLSNGSSPLPITNWQDEMRGDFFVEILEQELSQAAVDELFNRTGNSKRFTPLQLTFESQECLHAILPQLSDEQRASVKNRLVVIHENFPAKLNKYFVAGLGGGKRRAAIPLLITTSNTT